MGMPGTGLLRSKAKAGKQIGDTFAPSTDLQDFITKRIAPIPKPGEKSGRPNPDEDEGMSVGPDPRGVEI